MSYAPPAAEPPIPWQMLIPEAAEKHITQRVVFDIVKKKDMKRQPVSIVDR
jgi:hypothetical protein